MFSAMEQTITPPTFEPMPPETLDSFQTLSAVWWAERSTISFDAVRRVIHLLGEVIEEETDKGKRVEIELLGTFSKTADGKLLFDHEPSRDWLSMDTYIVSDLQDRLAGDRE